MTTTPSPADIAVLSPAQRPGQVPFKKAIGCNMLSTGVPYQSRFQQAVDYGFEAVEMVNVTKPGEADLVYEAAQATGIAIHSVLTLVHWSHPLTSGNPEDIRFCLRAIENTMSNGKLWGAKILQLNPGIVDSRTSHAVAYERSQKVIRDEVIPMAREFGIVIGMENMPFTGMVPSPLEYARYIEEFDSPWLRAYPDLGNIVDGYPEHWIRELGDKIVALHMKDFFVDAGRGNFAVCALGSGKIDWSAVRSALLETGFSGYVTTTSMPKGRLMNWIARGIHAGNKYNPGIVPGWSMAVRGLAAIEHQMHAPFVRDSSRRHDQFDAGTLGRSG